MLSFFARDHASTETVYANADLTEADQANEVVAFADYWARVAGTDPWACWSSTPRSPPTSARRARREGITFLTLRSGGLKLLGALAALPPSEWTAGPSAPRERGGPTP